MRIDEAQKMAKSKRGYMFRRGKPGCLVFVSNTDGLDLVEHGYIVRNWVPEADDIEADDWEVVQAKLSPLRFYPEGSGKHLSRLPICPWIIAGVSFVASLVMLWIMGLI